MRYSFKASGSIFLVAIWSLCFLSILAVVIGSSMRQKLMLVERFKIRQGLRPVAEAGIFRAISSVLKDPAEEDDSLIDSWNVNPALFKDVKTAGGYFRVSLVDEERKLNANTADRHVLGNLFMIVLGLSDTQAQELAASIVDWRDADSMLSIPLGSAEDADYRHSERSYEAKDAPLESFEELLLIKGMDRGILESLREYITVFGSDRVNINTASKPVLLALGLEESSVDKIMAYRAGVDKEPRTEDDRIFNALTPLNEQLGAVASLSEAESARLSAVSENMLTTRSSCFSADSLAYAFDPSLERLKNPASRRREYRVRATFNRKGKILQWKEE